MESASPTWVVLVRDVTYVISDGQPTMAALVLDAETGLIRGVMVDKTTQKALTGAAQAALTQWAGPLSPEQPGQLLCTPDIVSDVEGMIRELTGAIPVQAIGPIDEAEDVFDAVIGNLAGREPADEFPTPDDWRLLVEVSHAFAAAEPWRRWADSATFQLAVGIDDAAASFVAIVIGAEGSQAGLVLYPGDQLPEDLLSWEPDDPSGLPSLPEGTLLYHLNPQAEALPDFAAKAVRYGWPPDAKLMPVWVEGGPEGIADVDRLEVFCLALAMTAVMAHDKRTAGPDGRGRRTSGTLPLPEGVLGDYRITEM